MTGHDKVSWGSNLRKFFFRGLAILLPSVLTIRILIAAYNFVQSRIAAPINDGVKTLIVRTTNWPMVLEGRIEGEVRRLQESGDPVDRSRIRKKFQQEELRAWWKKFAFPLDLIGLIIAIVLIYLAGGLLGSFIGRRLYARGEEMLGRVPLVRHVYPHVKQITDFLVGGPGDDPANKVGPASMRFNRVVAVEYPRKGLWSVGLVTGNTMQLIEDRAAVQCLTVFVPSSPTPFTGYVVTVPKTDTIDLPITIDEAFKFTVSGGVIIPASQKIPPGKHVETQLPQEIHEKAS